jgi:hypothetical protein
MVTPLRQAHQRVNFGVRLEWTGDSVGGTKTVKMRGAEPVSSAQLGGDANDDAGDSAARGQGCLIGWVRSYFQDFRKSSEGRFSIVEHPIDPGRMVHPHVHAHEDEFSYILEGKIGARVGDEVPKPRPAAMSTHFLECDH